MHFMVQTDGFPIAREGELQFHQRVALKVGAAVIKITGADVGGHDGNSRTLSWANTGISMVGAAQQVTATANIGHNFFS